MRSARPEIPRNPNQQTGIALIAMLLVFGLVVILVGSAITQSSLNISRAGYHLQYSQAYQYALGAEALARQLLHQDWKDDQEGKKGDHLNESWAQPLQFEPDGGLMRVQIRDLERRFNLNSLITEDGKISSDNTAVFNRLLQQLDISGQLGAQIVDWIDSDSLPRTADSEDAFFQSQWPPYRSANQSMAHLSELHAMDLNADDESLFELRALTAVLPSSRSAININTAGREVLASLHKGLNTDEIIRERSNLESGFASKTEFFEHSVTAGLDLGPINIDVHSHYFEVWVIAQVSDQMAYLRSVLYRDDETGTIRTLHRDQSRNDRFNPLLRSSFADQQPANLKDND